MPSSECSRAVDGNDDDSVIIMGRPGGIKRPLKKNLNINHTTVCHIKFSSLSLKYKVLG